MLYFVYFMIWGWGREERVENKGRREYVETHCGADVYAYRIVCWNKIKVN